jgi:hypothetical protein
MESLNANVRLRGLEDNFRDKEKTRILYLVRKSGGQGQNHLDFFADGYGLMQTYEDGRYRLRKNFERGLRHFCFNQVALGRGLAWQD